MLPTEPPTVYQATQPLQQDRSSGWPVYSLQRALNDAAGATLAPDGAFGPATTRALKSFQDHIGITGDGICGPSTWAHLSAAVCRRLDRDNLVPKGLPAGFAKGEGGNNGAAVNWSVPNGVDCGLFQIRCYGPPYNNLTLGLAFSPYRAGKHAMAALAAKATEYAHPHTGCPFTPIQLGVLGHNFPWAAEQYFRFGRLPWPDRPAPWVPASLPATAKTYAGWCSYYVKMIAG